MPYKGFKSYETMQASGLRYRQSHKAEIAERMKGYYERNAETLKQKRRERYQREKRRKADAKTKIILSELCLKHLEKVDV